jgi:SAM-dependent methyltransferase
MGLCRKTIRNIAYSDVTEMPGTNVSREQVQRLMNRYEFAAGYCRDKDVLELACGPGIGLGLLQACSRRLVAGDLDENILEVARDTYGKGVDCRCIDAQHLPFEEKSFDVVILFEAIYYLPNPEAFVSEARRILRDTGIIIVCNPNKDLPDFNPSPHSHRYFNAPEFCKLFGPAGFAAQCFGDTAINNGSLKARFLSVCKKTAVSMRLMPKTAKGKKIFKRLVFGKLVPMPYRIEGQHGTGISLCKIPNDEPDTRHKVIFCVATLSDKVVSVR